MISFVTATGTYSLMLFKSSLILLTLSFFQYFVSSFPPYNTISLQPFFNISFNRHFLIFVCFVVVVYFFDNTFVANYKEDPEFFGTRDRCHVLQCVWPDEGGHLYINFIDVVAHPGGGGSMMGIDMCKSYYAWISHQ